jgi:hypothetical protein
MEATMKRTMLYSSLAVLSLLLWASCGSKEELHRYSWWKVSFDLPLQFSGPVDIGVGAAAFVHPAESEPGQADIEITLVSVPVDLQLSLDNDEDAILDFVKSTFLGTTKPADESLERTFLGKKIVGGLQDITIPRKGQMETYLIPLSDGDMVAVSVMHEDGISVETSQRIVDALASTMKELTTR